MIQKIRHIPQYRLRYAPIKPVTDPEKKWISKIKAILMLTAWVLTLVSWNWIYNKGNKDGVKSIKCDTAKSSILNAAKDWYRDWYNQTGFRDRPNENWWVAINNCESSSIQHLQKEICTVLNDRLYAEVDRNTWFPYHSKQDAKEVAEFCGNNQEIEFRYHKIRKIAVDNDIMIYWELDDAWLAILVSQLIEIWKKDEAKEVSKSIKNSNPDHLIEAISVRKIMVQNKITIPWTLDEDWKAILVARLRNLWKMENANYVASTMKNPERGYAINVLNLFTPVKWVL